MLLWKTLDVADNEIVLLFRRERLESVLTAGRHKIAKLGGQTRLETYDISQVVFKREQAKFLLNTYGDMLGKYIEMFELGDNELGLFYRDDHLVDIIAPGNITFVWKNVENVRIEVINIVDGYEIDKRLLRVLGRGSSLPIGKLSPAVHFVEIPEKHTGLLTVDGKLEKTLDAGSYGFWKFHRSINIKQVDLRLQSTDVSGQEILTKDRVSLRINLSATYRIVDAVVAVTKLADYNAYIYKELQLALREAVGAKSLDQMLEDKDVLNDVIFSSLKDKFSNYGVELSGVGIKDIILPGDMKEILNKVVEAQKEAEANLIRRREETQAMRSLHNTAKMMADNSVLMRLKELESLERIVQRIDKLTVYGGLDGVMNKLVHLSEK